MNSGVGRTEGEAVMIHMMTPTTMNRAGVPATSRADSVPAAGGRAS